MNVNISTQFLGDFRGNDLSKEVKNIKNEFISFFEDIENMSEEGSIDYDLILSVLNNLKNFENLNLNELYNLNNKENIDLESANNIFFNIIKSDLNNKNLSDKNLNNNLVFINDLTMNLDSDTNDKLLNTIINIMQSEDADIRDSENLNIKNLKDIIKNSLLNQVVNNEVSSNKTNDIDKISDLNQQMQVADLNEDKYSQLEISSLNSKNNIVKDININDKNKDLNTLENILDVGDNNNLLFLNKATSNIDTSNKKVIDTQPINTIRQEFIEEDTIKTIRYLKSSGIEEIKIKISPRELGDMTIKLIKNNDETNVNITISKEDVFELVNKNVSDITKHLNELNIKIKDISIDIKSNNEKFFSDNLNQEFNRKNQQNKKHKNRFNNTEVESAEEIKESKYIDNNLNILI